MHSVDCRGFADRSGPWVCSVVFNLEVFPCLAEQRLSVSGERNRRTS